MNASMRKKLSKGKGHAFQYSTDTVNRYANINHILIGAHFMGLAVFSPPLSLMQYIQMLLNTIHPIGFQNLNEQGPCFSFLNTFHMIHLSSHYSLSQLMLFTSFVKVKGERRLPLQFQLMLGSLCRTSRTRYRLPKFCKMLPTSRGTQLMVKVLQAQQE